MSARYLLLADVQHLPWYAHIESIPLLGCLATSSKLYISMNEAPGLHLKTFLLILMIVVFAPLGNVLLGKGMKSVGPATRWAPADLWNVFVRICSSGYIWLGVASLLTFFVAYMLVLTWADYSYVQPASSFSYAMVAVLGYLLLGEVISPLRWLGIGMICLGVLIVGHTPPRTTAERA
jgi:drug/metabolite transporter (DMT)-like permease